MNVVPLIVSIAAFGGAFFSIRYIDRVRSWMRRQSIGVAPRRVRESAYDIAPTLFAIGGAVLGIGFLAVFIKGILE
jgi:hypothetical protein